MYAGAAFQLAIRVPKQYPLSPPEVRFKTKIFHPNVHFKACSPAHDAVVTTALVSAPGQLYLLVLVADHTCRLVPLRALPSRRKLTGPRS